MEIDPNNKLIRWVMGKVQHYNHDKYWRYRKDVIDSSSRKPKFLRLFYLFYIKRCDAYSNASMGTDLGGGAIFKSPPILEHNLNGITIAHNARIGANCKIFQHVTITQGNKNNETTIGDNCLIGAGAVILGGVSIGDNVKIGANAVVTHDVESNSTVVGVPARKVK